MCDPEILLDLERKDYHLQRLSSIENAFLENVRLFLYYWPSAF